MKDVPFVRRWDKKGNKWIWVEGEALANVDGRPVVEPACDGHRSKGCPYEPDPVERRRVWIAFAGQALSGLLANAANGPVPNLGAEAARLADDMLRELDRRSFDGADDMLRELDRALRPFPTDVGAYKAGQKPPSAPTIAAAARRAAAGIAEAAPEPPLRASAVPARPPGAGAAAPWTPTRDARASSGPQAPPPRSTRSSSG